MLTAAILAGGRGTRFGGRDKSRLVVGSRPILDRQLDELTDIPDILLVGREASGHEPVGRFRIIQDRVPGSGPLGGLDAALAAARHDVVLVIACDMPFVTAGFLHHLASLAHADVAEAAVAAVAVVPQTEDGYHPLCAAYTRACHTIVMRRLADGKLAMMGLLDDVRVRVVSSEEIARFGDPKQLLANVNTPAALHGIEATGRHET
jgi:molybdenum cofactor guanylyltransferase